MRPTIRGSVQRTLSKLGYRLERIPPHAREFPPDFDVADTKLVDAVRPYTMTSAERIYSLRRAVAYIVSQGVPGAIVECGVWKGGSMMAAALTLSEVAACDRQLFLFDTFDGMTPPSDVDTDNFGTMAADLMRGSSSTLFSAKAGLNEVRAAMQSTGYDDSLIHYVPGRVEETVPNEAPPSIALLRLDTDWYESTKHELIHLYPRLSPGGVLIIDDYGYWRGARRATDEYLRETETNILLNRIDDTGRIGVKFHSQKGT